MNTSIRPHVAHTSNPSYSVSKVSPEQNTWDPTPKNKAEMAGGMAQVGKHLHIKHKALSSISSTATLNKTFIKNRWASLCTKPHYISQDLAFYNFASPMDIKWYLLIVVTLISIVIQPVKILCPPFYCSFLFLCDLQDVLTHSRWWF
jgi:hypothetical protein